MLCWELEQRLSRNPPHPDVSVALENTKRSFSVPSENMKMSFSVPSVWVSVASAAPQLLLHLTLHFPGCSPLPPAKLRSFAITLIFKKTQKPFCSPRGKISWELLACALQLRFQRSGDPWDVEWEVLLSHSALHTWGPMGESLQGVFSASQALPGPQGR